ncbi:MAG: hypothetical protein DRI46_11935, partial [Chloroflexi bacterium]
MTERLLLLLDNKDTLALQNFYQTFNVDLIDWKLIYQSFQDNFVNSDCLNLMGFMYEHGYGFSQNSDLSFHHYQMSADAGNMIGLNNLGVSYEKGIGTIVNLEKACGCYQRASELGCS